VRRPSFFRTNCQPRAAWKRYEARGTVWYASEHIADSWLLTVSQDDLSQFTLPAGKKHVLGISLEGDNPDGLPLFERTVAALIKNCDGVQLEL